MNTKKLLNIWLSLFAITCISIPTSADEVIRWRLAETWGANFPIFGDATQRFAENVKKMSNGRLIISVDSSNKHKSALGILDFVRNGVYQMGHSSSYYWKGKDIATLPCSAMPLGMIANEQHAWFYHAGGKELCQKVYDKWGVLNYAGGNTGGNMGGWFREEIKSVDDLQGLKIRIPGFAGEIYAELGAKTVNIASAELYTALERSTIDAVEWVGPSLDLRMGFHKIAPYYYTGWHEPGSELQFMVNKKAFEKLPIDLQAILEIAIEEAAAKMYYHSNYESAENWEKMKSAYPNIQIKNFPPEVISAFKKANEKLVSKLESKGGIVAEILQSQRDFIGKVRAWTEISDQAYLNNL